MTIGEVMTAVAVLSRTVPLAQFAPGLVALTALPRGQEVLVGADGDRLPPDLLRNNTPVCRIGVPVWKDS